jgi:2-C-methyl-D-erythritol 4-phosphate cytidylyltransferase/2-C-methyl-D-erythritol 2,4-cyclodiphosphate synthase
MEGQFADAVIVAAGASRRMGGIDKLSAPLLGRPLLWWSVAAIRAARSVRRLIVVVAPERLAELRAADWLVGGDGELVAELVAGGERRSDSVANGVRAADADIVLVHDGARPLVSSALVDAVAAAAARHGAAIPVLPVPDSLKLVDGELVGGAVERDGIAAAQTPQAARRELLANAFAAAAPDAVFTDEAALLAAHGVPVATVPGEPANLKVTRPVDLELARAILAGRDPASAQRTGFGQDSHPFGPDLGLWLGGVLIEAAPRLYGHSDGDVALHALATAILAAAGLGDLGRHFPPTDPATAGAASAGLLADVLRGAEDAGWLVASAQVSLLGARPRLGGQRLDQMRGRIASLLGVADSAVSVVAASGNLGGPEGAGLVVSASALATLVRR